MSDIHFEDRYEEITVRGGVFPVVSAKASEIEHSQRIFSVMILSLYALEDPRVDEVLKMGKFKFVYPDGKEVVLFPEEKGEKP